MSYNFIASEKILQKAKNAKSDKEFNEVFGLLSPFSSPKVLYEFAYYFIDRLSLNDIREIYKNIVNANNYEYIKKFQKDVFPKLQEKEAKELEKQQLENSQKDDEFTNENQLVK